MVLIGRRPIIIVTTFCAFVFFFFSPLANAVPQVTATVDSNNVGVGEVVQLSITVTSDSQMSLGDVRLPGLEGFDLLNSNQQTRQSIINGQIEMSQSYIYLLQANKIGNFTIPEVDIAINGETYKTKPINVKVNDKPTQQQKPQARAPPNEEEEDPFFDEADNLFQQLLKRHGLPGRQAQQPNINPNEAFFVQLEADKNEVYVGEQITASWWIYTRNSIQNIDTLKYPNLKAFFKEDIEVATRLDWKQEVINGIAYRKALLVSYALFPLKEGTALIDSYKARCTVMIGGGAFSFGQSYTFTKASPEIKVKVKPIPAASRPADFAGGIGQFQMKASVDGSNIATNQPFALKIRFEGRGNAKSIDLPALNLPKSLEVYSQRDETKFNREGASYKEFEILLIPREPGKITIPKLTMSFFDPSTARFYSGSTDAFELNVNVGKGGSGQQNVNPVAEPTPQKQALPGLIVEWESYKETSLWQQLFGWVVVFVLVALFIVWRVFVELQIGAKKKSLTNRMQKRLKALHHLISKGDWRKVGAELTNIIYLVVGHVTGDEGGSSLQFDKLFEDLAPSLRKEFEVPLKSQLSKCETLTFAPEEVVGKLRDAKELHKLKGEVEEILTKFIKSASATEGMSR